MRAGPEPSLSAHSRACAPGHDKIGSRSPIATDDEPHCNVPPRRTHARAADRNGQMNNPMTLTRPSSRRRHHRRSRSLASDRLFCRTNGCASFLDVDEVRGVATCHICGYTRRLPRPN